MALSKRINLKHLFGSIARTLLGLTFIFSGFVKAIDPLGTTYKIEDYLKAFGGFFTSLLPMAQVAAICLITFEFVLGVCLLCNVGTRLTSWLSLLMMVVMTPLTLYLAITNPIHDCGCFGDAIVLSNWATFWKNVVLLALVIVLLVFRKEIPSTFLPLAEWGICGIAVVAIGVFMAVTLNRLPIIDFRPYKIGNNLPELMVLPEGAAEDAEPPVHDFDIRRLSGEDNTDRILDADRVVLVIMYDLEKADVKQLQKVEYLAANAVTEHTPLLVLTGSGPNDIISFLNENAKSNILDSIFANCDPVTLKTIVRANPGVVVLENGTVVDKYNLKNRKIELLNPDFIFEEERQFEYDAETNFDDSSTYYDEGEEEEFDSSLWDAFEKSNEEVEYQ